MQQTEKETERARPTKNMNEGFATSRSCNFEMVQAHEGREEAKTELRR